MCICIVCIVILEIDHAIPSWLSRVPKSKCQNVCGYWAQHPHLQKSLGPHPVRCFLPKHSAKKKQHDSSRLRPCRYVCNIYIHLYYIYMCINLCKPTVSGQVNLSKTASNFHIPSAPRQALSTCGWTERRERWERRCCRLRASPGPCCATPKSWRFPKIMGTLW